MPSKKLLDSRAAAAKCLALVINGSSLSQQLPIIENQVKERDRALYRQFCYGVLRFYPKLHGMVKALVKKPLKKKDNDILMLMMLGIYQLSELRTPEHAAVSATVNATQSLKKPWAKGLINGVLRQWQRQHNEIEDALSDSEKLSHPEWLYKAINDAWPEQAVDIMTQNNGHPPMCLRINQRKTTQADYLQTLSTQEIQAQTCEFSNHGIRLAQAFSVNELPCFANGYVSVQDEAPQLSARLLQLEPGHRVLDACCAPGGKTCHILEGEPNLAEVIALDIDEARLLRVQENLERLQLRAALKVGDAAKPKGWWDGQQFDRILLDAPCSATGVIRRNPDIKLHRTAKDIDQLTRLQAKILNALWPTLKPDGLLVYATCSILPQENEQIIADFCQQQSDVEHVTIQENWGIERQYGRQLFPKANGHDGFFYALLRRR